MWDVKNQKIMNKQTKAVILVVVIAMVVVIFNVAQIGTDCSELRAEKVYAKNKADAFKMQYDNPDLAIYQQGDVIWNKHMELQREYTSAAEKLLDCTT